VGLVASIQISLNDMLRIGDWIGMEKYGADGSVTEINLITVKVRNWDNTFTTIPTYAFVSDSFKNWRGMQSSGVRRIKRHILLDQHSVKFADGRLLNQLKDFDLINGYLSERIAEIEAYNKERSINSSVVINGRQLTNIGIFREYALTYIRNHPQVDSNSTIMVRQLQATEMGLPLEIYCFSKIIEWIPYEGVASDIFDHLTSAVRFFDLEIFQSESDVYYSHLISKSQGSAD
jgi:miniconductance mechanosensitive channel